MPKLLGSTTIRLLECAVENLSASIEAFGSPTRIPVHDISSVHSVAMGLVGISIEMISSSLLVQTFGERKLLLPTGYFKSAAQVYDELVTVLKNPVPKLSFLVQGVSDPARHLQNVLSALKEFKILITMRANSVHAAKAPSREVIKTYINKVVAFLQLISASSRLSGYLSYLPSPLPDEKTQQVLLEDLVNKLQGKPEGQDVETLMSLFMVLPDIPDEQPEWLERIQRVSIAPKQNDIFFLLSVLEKCQSVSLIKNGTACGSLPVSIQPGNPNAIAIDPHYIKREFTKEKDQFYADIANANGRFRKGSLDLPPMEMVHYLCANGMEKVDGKFEKEGLTPTEAWPFIVASLSRNGTVGPYWFLVRKTNDKNQLVAQIKKAIPMGTGYLRRPERLEELLAGVDVIITSQVSTRHKKAFHAISQDLQTLEKLNARLKRDLNFVTIVRNPQYKQLMNEIADGTKSSYELIESLLADSLLTPADRIPIFRHLVNVADSIEDLPVLVRLLTDPEYAPIGSNIRKAIRVIDYLNYGPVMN